MISLLVTLIVFLILCVIVFQTLYVLNYQSVFDADGDQDLSVSESTKDEEEDGDAICDPRHPPPVAVILCLKGTDESLNDCLSGLICQDYPDFELHIVIHSPNDPATGVVEEFFSHVQHKPRIHFLAYPEPTCSLKCSAIVQAIEALPERIEVVALIDGDAVVDDSWLNDLVTPLEDSGIGATTGNRWYSPADGGLGSVVRKIWNAAAVVQMQRYQIAWGGALAIRKDVIERCGILATWRKSFCEDTPLTHLLQQHKLRLHRVPNLIIEDRARISLPSAFQWISRQLLTVRLHHPAWPMVLLHGVAIGVASIIAPLLIVGLFWWAMASDAWTLLQATLLYQAFNFVLLFVISRSNQRVINARASYNRSEDAVDNHLVMHFCATLITQVVQPFAIWQANSMEKVTWRGATYQVKDSGTLKLLNVKDDQAPARQRAENSAREHSATSAMTLSEEDYIPGSRFSKRSRN